MKELTCISPIDGAVVAKRQSATPEAAIAKVAAMRKAQKAWAARPLAERVALVRKATEIIGGQTERMARELALQMGRPIRYGGEFRGFNERVSYMCDIAEASLKPMVIEDSPTALRQIAREPLGVVLVIAPWNYPYMTAVNTIAPALVAGNVVLLKHSEQTLMVGEHMAEAFHAAGIPADVFDNIFLDHAGSAALISGRHVNFVNFTGSVKGGAAIEQAAAGTFINVATELGGKDPAYIRHDANLDAAVDGAMDGAMFNAGQCCCGIERIYVHESLYDAFVEKAVAWVKALKLGNPLDQDTTIGPMANIRFARTVREHIAEAVAQGAIAHIPTMPADDGGAYVTPQILTNVTHAMKVMREETFGPVVGIMKVKDDEEAIALMNDSDFGLTASLWTEDTKAAEAIGARLETGTVFQNRCDYLDPALCWTGCKDTGRGAGLSVLGYLALTRPKSYHLKRQL
ncbi:aldehyde dehydrogenase family protein [Acidocella sp.]|uniref:aldehyde dehydrogenase family protein n=1 Tax=Acidocella sp. TaxID=50710 RepID=UPI0026397416|nr:aldehyde dehydrogenase family protein [Acidocella sp.]